MVDETMRKKRQKLVTMVSKMPAEPLLKKIIVIYSREKLKLFFPEGGATPKDVYFPSRRRGKYESEGVGTPQGEKSSISPRSL